MSKKPKEMLCTFAAAILAAVVSVDIRPDALAMLKSSGPDAWISDVYYT